MIAVVGYKGFIGSHLFAAMPDAKTFGNGDKLDFSGCEVVYNCAGVSGGVGLLEADPLAMVGANVRIALDVFDAAKRDGVKQVIAMSSTTGYPESDHALMEDEYFLGEVHPAYNNPGETRRFIERLGGMYPFDVTFIRCAGAYGPGDKFDPALSHVIAATIRKVAERQDPIVCWGDGRETRDGTHIDDLIKALVACKGLPGKQAINIGTGEQMSVDDMIRVLCVHANHSPKIIYDMSKTQMIRQRLLNNNRARILLRWTPTISMEQGLCATLDWYAGQ